LFAAPGACYAELSMAGLRSWWRSAFDVRKGEYARTVFMGLYFFFVLCAVHLLKPVAWSLFLNAFPVRNLPYLYILIAVIGGLLAYLYTKLAVRTSLYAAMAGSTALTVVSLLVLWRLLDLHSKSVLYIFAIWVNLFGIVFVSQGWLIATNLFTGREAKRLYGLLGLGSIIGATVGGVVTTLAAERAGSEALVPIGILVILLAFASLHCAAVAEQRRTGQLPSDRFRKTRPAAEDDDEEQPDFTIRDVVSAVARHRHLLVIVGIIITTYVVEVLVEFQFNVLAKATYSGDDLTAFLGRFNGIYLSVLTFFLQFFITTVAVERLGVGRTLLISPLSVGAASIGVLFAPGMVSAAITRLGEASTRYSISRTAIELLYLPLPTELKNRTKAFVDVFVDLLGRGLAALLLLVLMFLGLQGQVQLSLLIIVFSGIWVLLAVLARKEYMATVRRRVEGRRLDLDDARVTVHDSETVRLLEQAARGSNARQVVYGLSLLAGAPGYHLSPLLNELASSGQEVIRAKVYMLARKTGETGLLDRALAEIRGAAPLSGDLARAAAAYVVTMSEESGRLAAELIEHPNPVVGEAALSALSGDREHVQQLISRKWLVTATESAAPERRALAAFAIGVRGDEGTDALYNLLNDPEPRVVQAACCAAGRLANRDYLPVVVEKLGDPKTRGAATEALVSYGEPIREALGEILRDPDQPFGVRLRIPRVLSAIPVQHSVDVLRRSLMEPNLAIRSAVLHALSRVREAKPHLNYGEDEVRDQILLEARQYFQLCAALELFRQTRPGGKATALLARTIDERLRQTIERLFRLLGLRYPPKQIRAAYLAVSQRRSEEFSAALEFLDNILEHDLKSVLLPMIDGSPHLLDIGRERFGIEPPSLAQALLDQIRREDPWLAACAVAAVAELQLHSLAGEVALLAERGDPVVAPVARGVLAALG